MDNNSSMDIITTAGCGCPGCQNGQNYTDPVFGNSNIITDDAISAPTTYGTAQQMADQLVTGFWQYNGGSANTRQWAQDTVTYSFGNGYSAAEEASFRAAFDQWSDIADIQFTEVGSGGDISIVEGSDGSAHSGSSYYAGTGNIASNTLSIDTDTNSWGDLLTIGGYGVQTILHEIGHSLGLGHQGNYNGNVNYDTQVTYLNDNRQYSIMSYNNADRLGTDHFDQGNNWEYAATPLLYDIMAIQQIYGVNNATRSGNTTYGFNSNAGLSQYDLSVNDAPFAIWDGAGTDTLDLSGYSTNQTITLVAGDFTSAGYMTNNIVIAYGATIENAIGGSGNDSITGNTANNILTGGSGNDTLYGSTGSDTLHGGNGTDTVNYSYSFSEFLGSFTGGTNLTLTNATRSFTDTLDAIENFVFNGVAYTFAELQGIFAPSNISVRTIWNGGAFEYNSSEVASTNLDAGTIGYGGTTGNVVNINRQSNTQIDVNILSANAPNALRITGSDIGETFNILGTHANMGTSIYAGAGNDTIVIAATVVGADKLYGEAGDDILSSGAGNDMLYGGSGNDSINAGDNNDIVYGGDDNDTINGGNGNDALYGDAGTDIIDGDAGIDYIYGGDGTDTLRGGTGNDRILGENGIDTIYGEDGHDTIYGGAGNDLISGGDGNDKIWGDGDDDTITGGAGVDRLYGGDGLDNISGGSETDYIYGNDGVDTLDGDAGNDSLYGGDGNDIMYGGTGNDKLYGQNDDDVINGEDGVDRLYGDAGVDILNGGNDTDYLYGGTGTDTLNGGNGDDVLYGQNDNDRINGDAGVDRLFGGNGTDTLVGGADADFLYGQGGADIFGLTDLGAADLIVDFTLSGPTKDIINITDILTGYDSNTDDINDFATLVFKHGNRADLYVDADGAGGDWALAAVIQGSDLTGIDVDFLTATSQLVTEQTLL